MTEKEKMSIHVESKLVFCRSLLVEIVVINLFSYKTFSINYFHGMYRAKEVKLSVLAQFSLIVQY